MKLLSILFTIVILSSFQKISDPNFRFSNETETTAIPLGDINNDHIPDTAFVKSPKWLNEDDGYGDPKYYNIDISFSCKLPSIHNKDVVSAVIENIGDIDKDGYSEIIIIPSWFIGCHGVIEVYSMKNGNWKNLGFAKRNICGDGSYRQYIKSAGKNKIKIMEQVPHKGDILEKAKTIKIE